MRDELEKKLSSKYSFMQRKGSSIYDDYGCQCDDGWYDLLDETCAQIQAFYDAISTEPSIIILQIKEKFGTLRIYFGLPEADKGLREKLTKIVDDARARSAQVCEICGGQGEMRRNGYLQVLCAECFELVQKVDDPSVPVNMIRSEFCKLRRDEKHNTE